MFVKNEAKLRAEWAVSSERELILASLLFESQFSFRRVESYESGSHPSVAQRSEDE